MRRGRGGYVSGVPSGGERREGRRSARAGKVCPDDYDSVPKGPFTQDGRETRRVTQCKQMGPIVVNGSVHTVRRQHQRKNIPICMRLALRVLCELGPSKSTL